MTALAKTHGGGWLAAPQNMQEVYAFAKTVAASDLAPKDYRNKPDNVLVAIQLGSEVGLSPMQALQNIAVINGRPSIWGDAQLALVRAHPSVLGYSESWDEKTQTWTCTLRRLSRDGQAEVTVGEFSMADAVRAKLANKQGPWTEYPKRMIKMRARSWCLRDGAADILKGLAQGEEAQDMEPLRAAVVPEAPRAAIAAQASEPEQPPQPPPAATKAPALPTRTAKNYAVKAEADKPFTELSDAALAAYLVYYTERMEQAGPTLQAQHKAAIAATIKAAEAELQRRLEVEGQPLPDDHFDPGPEPEDSGDDGVRFNPETGEVLDHPPADHPGTDDLEPLLEKSIEMAKQGVTWGDRAPEWGLDGADAPANQTGKRSRKGAA
jgi:hypothetical protein